MNLADVFTVVFVILGFLVVYVAYWLMAAALCPGWIDRCADQIQRAPMKTTFLGAVTLIPLLALGSWISNAAPNGGGKLIGVALLLLSLLVALFGSAGFALLIGRGLRSARDEQEPWRRVLRGGIVLGLSFVLPFVGTFLLMPFTFIAGFGAFVLTRPRRARAAVPQPEPAPMTASVPPAEVPPPFPSAS